MASGREASDPLAELARLVGQEDPYRNVFRPAPAAPTPTAHEQDWHEDPAGVADHRYPPHDADRHHDDAGAEHWHPGAAAAPDGRHPADAEMPAEAWAEHDDAYERQHDEADDERYYAIDAASHRDDAGIAETAAAVDGAEASIPDLWARGGSAAGYGAAPEIDPVARSGSRADARRRFGAAPAPGPGGGPAADRRRARGVFPGEERHGQVRRRDERQRGAHDPGGDRADEDQAG